MARWDLPRFPLGVNARRKPAARMGVCEVTQTALPVVVEQGSCVSAPVVVFSEKVEQNAVRRKRRPAGNLIVDDVNIAAVLLARSDADRIITNRTCTAGPLQ